MGLFWRQEQTRKYSQVCKSLMMLLVEKTRIEKWVSLSQNIDVAGTVGRVKQKGHPRQTKWHLQILNHIMVVVYLFPSIQAVLQYMNAYTWPPNTNQVQLSCFFLEKALVKGEDLKGSPKLSALWVWKTTCQWRFSASGCRWCCRSFSFNNILHHLYATYATCYIPPIAQN